MFFIVLWTRFQKILYKIFDNSLLDDKIWRQAKIMTAETCEHKYEHVRIKKQHFVRNTNVNVCK